MHIEKINDNQIKCTLSQRDLLARELDLNELAYGTEKAISLFREMVEQAHDDFGFEAENTPLMVEAIPVSRDSIILIITRIDNPDELDTRFSRFSSMAGDDILEEDSDFSNGADDILDLFRSFEKNKNGEDLNEEDCDEELFQNTAEEFQELSSHLAELAKSYSKEISDTVSDTDPETVDAKGSASAENPSPSSGRTKEHTQESMDKPINLMRIYAFDKLDDLLDISRILHPIYNGVNSLYKDESSSVYYLVIYQSHHTPADFNKVCNLLSEYGHRVKGSCTREAYYAEHYDCIVSQTALQRLFLF